MHCSSLNPSDPIVSDFQSYPRTLFIGETSLAAAYIQYTGMLRRDRTKNMMAKVFYIYKYRIGPSPTYIAASLRP